jgi:hypothetical protein
MSTGAAAYGGWMADVPTSTFMSRLRRRFRFFGFVGGAVSHAEMGPYAGAPRNPNLRVGADDAGYATVRYSTDRYAYTSTTLNTDECRRCGRPLVQETEIEQVEGEHHRVAVGVVRTCRACQADSWMLHSRMPAVARARAAARKTVL